MQFELTEKQYRRLLDLVYIGNWILNSARGQDRFSDYDEVESLLFAKSFSTGMKDLAELWHGQAVPSRAFVTGGIHEASPTTRTRCSSTSSLRSWPPGYGGCAH